MPGVLDWVKEIADALEIPVVGKVLEHAFAHGDALEDAVRASYDRALDAVAAQLTDSWNQWLQSLAASGDVRQVTQALHGRWAALGIWPAAAQAAALAEALQAARRDNGPLHWNADGRAARWWLNSASDSVGAAACPADASAELKALWAILSHRVPPDNRMLLDDAARQFFTRELQHNAALGRVLQLETHHQIRAVRGQMEQVGARTLNIEQTQQTLKQLVNAGNEDRRRLLQLVQEVVPVLQELRAMHGEVTVGLSASLADTPQSRRASRLVEQLRALPKADRDQYPALVNGQGKLELALGGEGLCTAARETFAEAKRALALGEASLTDQAEAAYNAYRAALEEQNWDAAVELLNEAAQLDAERFEPFPLSRYQLQRILGSGGFGTAFLCGDRYLEDTQVVLKSLHQEQLDRDVTEIFREANLLKELEHRHIVGIWDVGFAGRNQERPYLKFKYFESVDLESWCNQRGHLSQSDMEALFQQAASALAHAHQRGILHRDIKPANILVAASPSGDGTAITIKVIDFGLGVKRRVLQRRSLSLAGDHSRLGSSVVGTLRFSPPEQRGESAHSPTAASDLYSLAKTCVWARFGTTDLKRRHRKLLPEPWEEILDDCLEDDPADRPTSADAVLARSTPQVPVPGRQLPDTSETDNDASPGADGADGADGAGGAGGAGGHTPTKRSQPRVDHQLLQQALADQLGKIPTAADWDSLTAGASVPVTVTGRNSGGWECQLASGIRAFLPYSQANVHSADEMPEYVGKQLICLVTDVDASRRSVMLSHKAGLAQQGSREPTAAHRAGGTRSDNQLELNLVYCPPGRFRMGEPEQAVDVRLTRGFWLGQTPVTQAQYESLMGTNPSRFQGANRPVEQVNWEDAREFCRKLTDVERSAGRLASELCFTLPTEAQWEYACRAGTTSTYAFGDDADDLGDYGWSSENSGGQTREVAQKLPNAWGFYDMHGQVLEWCLDWLGPLQAGEDPIGSRESFGRVLRGGSWHSDAERCTAGFRTNNLLPTARSSNVGFRIAQVPLASTANAGPAEFAQGEARLGRS